ncbi:MAG: hypothetical protein ABJN40_01725 [Sneathiella sp.]
MTMSTPPTEKSPPPVSEVKTPERRLEKEDQNFSGNQVVSATHSLNTTIFRIDFNAQYNSINDRNISDEINENKKDQTAAKSDVSPKENVSIDVNPSVYVDKSYRNIGNTTNTQKKRISSQGRSKFSQQGSTEALYQRFFLRDNHFNVAMSPHKAAKSGSNPLHVPQDFTQFLSNPHETSNLLPQATENTSRSMISNSQKKLTGNDKRHAIIHGKIQLNVHQDEVGVYGYVLSEISNRIKDPVRLYHREQVTQYENIIEKHAHTFSISPDFLKSIVYLETTHGWYDVLDPDPDTILPGNVYADLWKGLGIKKAEMRDPDKNIHATAQILGKLWEATKDPTVQKVASLYNNIKVSEVSQYGRTVEQYMYEKPWESKNYLLSKNLFAKESMYQILRGGRLIQEKLDFNLVRPLKEIYRDPNRVKRDLKHGVRTNFIQIKSKLSHPNFWMYGR